MLLGWRLEGICNYGSCPHGGGRDGDVNRAHGCIQLASKLGMRAGTCITTAEQQYDENRWKRKRVGTLRSQVHWLSGLLTRWHMVAQSSHDGHMTSEGCFIPRPCGCIPTMVLAVTTSVTG